MSDPNQALNLEAISEYASAMAGVVEEQPFGPDVDVMAEGMTQALSQIDGLL